MVSSGRSSIAARLTLTLLPSPISALLCLCFGVGVVMVWCIATSLHIGTALPDLFGGEWSVAYTNLIVQPLLRISNNAWVGKTLLLLGWGIAGLVVYGLIELASTAYRNWRSSRDTIQMPTYGVVVRRPTERSFWLTLVVRTTVTIIGLLIIVLVTPRFAHPLESLIPQLLAKSSTLHDHVRDLLKSMAAWALYAHLLLVTLRLLVLRPRLF